MEVDKPHEEVEKENQTPNKKKSKEVHSPQKEEEVQKEKDQRYLVALFHLPIICGNTKMTGKLKPGHFLVHVVKSSETWTDVAQAHKTTSGVWILHNTIGDKTATLLMERDNVLSKCTGAEEAILAMLGYYYLGILPYPAQVTGPLLLLQDLVLEDKIHSGDTNVLNKAKKEFAAYASKNQSTESTERRWREKLGWFIKMLLLSDFFRYGKTTK
uniref:Uncharacterized protein n=1 Tax=Magallana gigas TaxID=29159 RepID=K1P1T5_MAGGI